ncbi:hypothetical protein CLF_106443 [Clonorchis sinensis]|uniref:Uncharacterized protein n=1 Tax=Clonorchis sinensis TaxID=79923 RepID=G7YF62_CLOSI|nr:hypothetical protein CLF_106443 [Clonorchis sinensis]
MRAVLLYGRETWSVRAAEMRRLQVFDNRCLRTILVWVGVGESVTGQLESEFWVVQGVFPLNNVSSTRSCVGWDMCCACLTIVCRRECCFPCPIQSGVSREVANP